MSEEVNSKVFNAINIFTNQQFREPPSAITAE
jgi:hypothetical protein